MAAITGTLHLLTALQADCHAFPSLRILMLRRALSDPELLSARDPNGMLDMSMPEENILPSPVSNAHRTVGSLLMTCAAQTEKSHLDSTTVERIEKNKKKKSKSRKRTSGIAIATSQLVCLHACKLRAHA